MVVTPILVFAAVLAQAPPPAAEDGPRLDRIRKALEQPPAITTAAGTDDAGRPVFRMNVRAPKPQKPLWDYWTNVPSYIRPNMPGYHYEHMWMVTPEEFRGGTFYAMNIPIGPLLEALGKRIKIAHRKSQEEKAREEVRQALDGLLECRADPARPGC